MKIEPHGDTLQVSEVGELGATQAAAFRDEVRAAFTNGQRNIEIDLSQTAFLDSCGLGALTGLHKTATSRQGRVRLRNPLPQVRQILELTRMPTIFEIVDS